ncbi:MAG: T-complex 10 C-terminal domain-containing protein [Sulfurimonas sp.]|jgi:hypothetical protein
MKIKLSLLAFLSILSVDGFSVDFTASCPIPANQSWKPVSTNVLFGAGNWGALYCDGDSDYHLLYYHPSGGNVYRDVYSHNSLSCPLGTILNKSQVCEAPVLSDFDKDSVGCSKAGGTFISTGTEQVGGTSYGASFFGGSGIVLGGDIKAVTKCATPMEVVQSVVSIAGGLIPMLSKLFGSPALKKLTNTIVLDSFKQLPLFKGSNNMPDTFVPLPRLPAPKSPSMEPTIALKNTPVPFKSGETTPSRAPQITVDTAYSAVKDIYIPVKSSGDPVLDYAVVNRANTFIPTDLPMSLSSVVPTVGTSYIPVRETFDFSQVMPDQVQPPIIANVPTTTTKTSFYSGADPIDAYRTITNYPDGSSSLQTVRINSATQSGDLTVTNLASTGESNTITRPFIVSNYAPNSSSNTIPSNPITFTSPMTSSSPVTIPDPQNNISNILNPDGSTVMHTTNGTTYTVNSNGSTQTTLSDGTTSTTASTTTFQYDGTSQTTFPDGTIKTVASNGTTQYASPTGQISSTAPQTLYKPSFQVTQPTSSTTGTALMNIDGSTSTINSNGSVITANKPDGSTIVVNPDGSTTTTNFNGTTSSTTSTTKSLPDGSIQTTYPDGSTKIIMPNGSVQYATPTGQTNTIIPQTPSNADGTTTIHNADGGTTTINPNGTSTTTNPNGTTTTANSNGTTTTTKPDGTTTTSKPDGSSTTHQPDGTTTTVYPDGSTSTSHPDGTTTTTNSTTTTATDGTTQTTFPDGTTTISKPDGTTTTTKPDGTTTTTKPDGSTQTTFPEGTIKTTAPDGTTKYTTPTGQTTSPLPQTSPTTGSNSCSSGGGETCATDLINAKMPNFSFSDIVDFSLYDVAPIRDMVDSTTLMFGNIKTQLDSAKTTFDTTKAMLDGSWKAPVFEEGSCGDSMSFNFHGRNVDFCPPVMNFTSQYSPLFSSVTSIAGTGLAISIFLGGF